MAPTVTALREKGNRRVAVELDGSQWRVLPADAVVRAGLRTGGSLDRERARTLAQELRRSQALAVAARILRHRDLPTRRLAERLAAQGIAPSALRQALETLARTGLLDDRRFAHVRAQALADRNRGDAAVRHDLEARGLPPELVEEAVAELPSERERAARIVVRRGRSAATARYLARLGFDADSVEDAATGAFAQDASAELG